LNKILFNARTDLRRNLLHRLAHRLQAKEPGQRVAVFHRGSTPLQELSGIEEILGEKTELPGFRDEFRRFRPEAVIDCIGYTPSDGAKIVETFKGWLERLVFLSSCDVYERIK